MTDAPGPIPTSVSEAAQRWLAQPRQTGEFPPLDDHEAWRAQIATADEALFARFEGIDLPVTVDEIEVAGVPTFLINSAEVADPDASPLYLYVHGGGLFMGAGDACRAMSSAAALGAGMPTYAPDYRMPPDHPYPAALDDLIAVYRALLRLRPPEQLFVGGASAGGNLSAALMVRALHEGLPMPAALVLQTPEIDLTESGDSFVTNATFDNVLGSLMPVNLLYANGADLAHPYLSPLFADPADLAQFPPTFLQAGTRDLYLSNTVRMHRALRNAGVDAELHVWEAMPHGGFGGAPEDIEIMIETRRFLEAHRA